MDYYKINYAFEFATCIFIPYSELYDLHLTVYVAKQQQVQYERMYLFGIGFRIQFHSLSGVCIEVRSLAVWCEVWSGPLPLRWISLKYPLLVIIAHLVPWRVLDAAVLIRSVSYCTF